VRADVGGWDVGTVAYRYRLDDADGVELASWHWHPYVPNAPRPHSHIALPGLDRRPHLPSGQVTTAAILRLLLTDLGVPATRPDWASVLDSADEP
jgi:hypothetical protein